MTIVKLLSFRLPTHQAWGSLTPGRFRLLGIGNTISYTTKERVKAMRRTKQVEMYGGHKLAVFTKSQYILLSVL